MRWGETRGYAQELRALLEQLRDEAPDPRTGVELAAAFYRADARLLGACDDSDGIVGDIFRLDARDLFGCYAARCEDKDWVAGVVLDLVKDDDYGVRDSVLGTAATYLPGSTLRGLADQMWQAARATPAQEERASGVSRSHWYMLVERVAGQLNDPQLFERARRAWCPELGTAACTDIARAWLRAGEAEVALSWLDRVGEREQFKRDERQRLRCTIYSRLGSRVELEQLLWARFRRDRGVTALQELLEVIGPGHRDGVVAGMAETILADGSFTVTDAVFLMENGLAAEAASYLVGRNAQVDGDQWPSLLPVAEGLMAAGQPLGATVIYRALLDSILARAQSPAYGHGVRYLRLLGQLARSILDWRDMPTHDDYAAAVRVRHGRKVSFWRRYEGEAIG